MAKKSGNITEGIEILKKGIRIYFQYHGKKTWGTLKLGRPPLNSDIKYAVRHRDSILNAIADELRGGKKFDYRAFFTDSKKIPDGLGNTSTKPMYELCDEYIEMKRKGLEASTFDRYERIVRRWIKPHFGDKTVGEITVDHIETIFAAETATDVTLKHYRTVLRQIFKKAIKDKLRSDNPTDNLKSFADIRDNNKIYNKRDRSIPYFAPDEIELFLSSFLSEKYRNMFQFAMWSGLRPGEYMALEWADIDFKKREIDVNKNIYCGIEKKRLKTEAGKRKVKMLDGAYEALQRQKKLTYWHKSKVFLNRLNKPFTHTESIRTKIWQPNFERCGLEYRKLYSTRHTYASYCLTLGEPSSLIALQMGHANDVLFRKTYATIIKEVENSFGEKMNEFYQSHFKKEANDK